LQEGERGDVARVVGVQSEDGLKLPVGAAAGAGMMEVPVCVCVCTHLADACGTYGGRICTICTASSYVTHMHTFCTATAAT